MTPTDLVQQKLETLPTKPGCYLFKDSTGKIIYVGKAINLRSRVRSYFHESVDSPKTAQLVTMIADLETIIVGSELEALILEMNLIKKHRPAQRSAQRRQALSLHQSSLRRPVPHGDGHAPHGRRWQPLLRPIHQRVGGAPDARRAA
jgi:hypothetical protein